MSLIRSIVARFARQGEHEAVTPTPRRADMPGAGEGSEWSIDATPMQTIDKRSEPPSPWVSELKAFSDLPDFPVPAVIPSYGPDTKWEWGNIDIRAFLHTGAIVEGGFGGGRSVIVKGWDERYRVVERTIDQGGLKYGEDREHCTYPCTALTRYGSPKQLVRSLTPRVPSGTFSDDPALLVVPYGRYRGLTLGQLTPIEKEELLGIVRRWDAREAIKKAAFWPEAHALRGMAQSHDMPALPEHLCFSLTHLKDADGDVWVAGAMSFLKRDDFDRVCERARSLGGRYRSVQHGATVTGFHFCSEAAARLFTGITEEISVEAASAEISVPQTKFTP